MAVDYSTRRFTVDEYVRMAEMGIIGPDEKVELIDGEIVTVPPMGDAHALSMRRGMHLLIVKFDGRAVISAQLPIGLGKRSMPEPDFCVLHWDPRFYADRQTTPADVYAIVEVSDSRLAFDRGKKLGVYARAGIPDYWIVNIPDDVIEVYRGPHDLGYAPARTVRRGERIALLAFPDDLIAAEELLP